MPMYDCHCPKCKTPGEEFFAHMSKRHEEAAKQICSICHKPMVVSMSPHEITSGVGDINEKASHHCDWNSLLKRIKKSAGRTSTIEL